MYDARGNGDGDIVPTITGDHNGHISDYTAIAVKQAYGISSYSSNAMKSDNPYSGIYKAETSRTIDTSGGNPACNQGGMIIMEVYSIQGSMIGRKDKNGPNGSGINKDVSFTLNTIDQHAVACDCRSLSLNDEISGTLQAKNNGGYSLNYINPVVIQKNADKSETPQKNDKIASFYPQMKAESQCYREDGISNTLVNGTNPGFQNGIVNLTSAAFITYGKGTRPHSKDEAQKWNKTNIANTLNNFDVGEQRCNELTVNTNNLTVRRLIPVECARLQGFPDWWGEIDYKEVFTDEEYEFWKNVYLTCEIIAQRARPDGNGWYEIWKKIESQDTNEPSEWINTYKPYRHKSRKKLLQWYNGLHTDGAEYKMWGNGIALPPALFIMRQIAYITEHPDEEIQTLQIASAAPDTGEQISLF